ncbi:MAG TPA: isochorismatase family protein [Aliidongia sp.]|nr:isochorismatase family protein [Aliidongia sp.]
MNLNVPHNRFADRLHPRDAVLVLVDCQDRLIERVAGGKAPALLNNISGLARLAHSFDVPVVLGAQSPRRAGPVAGELVELFGRGKVVTRKSSDFWSDPASRAAVLGTGRREIVMAGLVPGLGIAAPALAARKDGFQLHAVLDASASGDITAERLGIARMTASGVRLTTWVAMLAEFAATGIARGAAAMLRENLERYSCGTMDGTVIADYPLGGLELPLTA